MVVAHETPTTSVPLRPGPNGLPRGGVTEIQRGRMLAAAVQVVAEAGYARMTVAQVIRRARVSRKTFYFVFRDREHCFLWAFDRAVAGARAEAEKGYRGGGDWREGIRGALAGVLEFLDSEQGLAKLCVVEALGAGPRVLARRAELLAQIAALLDRGRATATVEPPLLAAEGALAGAVGVVHARVAAGHREPLRDLLGPLMQMLTLPYVGAEEARGELALAEDELRRPRARGASEHTDSLDGLDMRLTYRTVRVLMALADCPGASNRELAQRSDIADQGQISKLLTRLAGLQLVTNMGEGQEKGMSNAWHLTDRGARIERATRLA
jgi:AcrR family transcriptional regulator